MSEVPMHEIDWAAAARRPYLLLTPGPLSTTPTVRAAMLRDWCTWDDDYNRGVVEEIRRRLSALASPGGEFEATLMQGSGTFSVEATVTTALGGDDRLLVAANGAYGSRIARIAARAGIDHVTLDFGERSAIDVGALGDALERDPSITHVAVVHCETTTGRLNPLDEIAPIVKTRGRTLIVDAMSSFGGMPLDLAALDLDFVVSGANKCIQGVPGFGFVLARPATMATLAGRARSYSLDLYDQWREMNEHHGKWRFTSPTHVVRAFLAALEELEAEGGPEARHARYRENQRRLVAGMRSVGFETLLPDDEQSPFITAFLYPAGATFRFPEFYAALKRRGFVIYPGKVTDVDAFRIGTIGDVAPADVSRLLGAVDEAVSELSTDRGAP